MRDLWTWGSCAIDLLRGAGVCFRYSSKGRVSRNHVIELSVQRALAIACVDHHHLWWECWGRCCVVCPWQQHEGVGNLF